MGGYTLEMLTAAGWSADPENFSDTAPNAFATRADAESALAELQRLWPDAEMRIVGPGCAPAA